MKSEKWELVKDIFDIALQQTPGERAQVLDELCGNDHDVRREVESLLSSFDTVGGFMAQPVVGEAAEAEAIQQNILTNGQYLGHYEICGEIGAGGMGQVYLARDTRLNRLVALKILPPTSVSEEQARQRLWREARAAATLEHPNICAIYEIAEANGFDFIVMQYVKGETIAEKLKRQKMSLREILHHAIQIADALDEAHAHGIIHCDIKPANVITNEQAQVKVLDFGLARFSENLDARNKNTGHPLSSKSGAIMGTVPWMSPEQVGGKTLDPRTDIFSFGAMLYEMASGRLPFVRDTDAETISAILGDEPSWENVPRELQPILRKCLAKCVDERYQTAKDLATDLRKLQDHLDSRRRSSLWIQSAEVSAPHPSRRLRWAAAVLIAVALTAGSALVVLRRQYPVAPAHMEYTPLTNFADSATSPALSPDGRVLALIRSEYTFGGPGQIYVKHLPDGELVQLTHDDLYKRGSPKFSRDGLLIAYAASKPGSGWDTWVVPALGGEPRLFLTNASGLTWIEGEPGQSRVLFSEMTGRGVQMAIASSTENRAQHSIVYMPPETGMVHRSYLSPDRKQVLLVEMDRSTWSPCRVAPFNGSSPGKRVGPVLAHCTDAAWSPDGNWMYFSADTGSGYHIWRQRFPDGLPEQITFGVTQEEGIELAPDGHSFVTSIGASQSTVWLHDSQGDRQITSEGYGLLPSVSPDGKKLYYLQRAGGERHFVSGELWVADLESGTRQRLLPDFLMQHYAISADGQRVVFISSDDTGRSPAWVASLDGRPAPRQISTDTVNAWKTYFVAGGYVIFLGEEKGKQFVFRVNENGGELQKIVRIDSGVPTFSVSPDGDWVVIPGSSVKMEWSAMAYPVVGGSPTPLCLSCVSGNDVERTRPPGVSWSPDGKFMYLQFHESTYAIPLRPGQMLPTKPATGFQSKEELASFPGAQLIPEPGAFPGPNPSIYAFTKVATHRNIYRVPVP